MSWRDRYYEEGYLRRWRLLPSGPSEFDQARGYLDLADLPAGSRILDIGCGHGRYSVALARNGTNVFGVDASMALLQRAQAQADGAPNQPEWIRADMRSLPFRQSFDGALLVDAFGYFDGDGEDAHVLAGVHDVLHQGGRLVMRNPNATPIRSNFRASDEERRDGRKVAIRSTLDTAGRWLDQHLMISDAGGVDEFTRRQRIYSALELESLLESAGFTAVEHYADASGSPFDQQASLRMITVCRST